MHMSLELTSYFLLQYLISFISSVNFVLLLLCFMGRFCFDLAYFVILYAFWNLIVASYFIVGEILLYDFVMSIFCVFETVIFYLLHIYILFNISCIFVLMCVNDIWPRTCPVHVWRSKASLKMVLFLPPLYELQGCSALIASGVIEVVLNAGFFVFFF